MQGAAPAKLSARDEPVVVAALCGTNFQELYYSVCDSHRDVRVSLPAISCGALDGRVLR